MPLPTRPTFKSHEIRKLEERIRDLNERLAEDPRTDSPRHKLLSERKDVYVKMLQALQADE